MSVANISQQEIIRKNIAATLDMQEREVARRTIQDRVADAITNFFGSMAFVYIHVVWFGLWVLLNLGLVHIPHVSGFDPFPFGLLTMVVSLEAIFLSTFVLISQNRMARLSEKRTELDLQVNMLAEQKAAKTLEMLDELTRQLDQMGRRFNFQRDPEVEALKRSPEPHEVLAVIDEAAAGELEEIKEEIQSAVGEVTGEVEAVREGVDKVSSELEEVAEDVQEVKAELGRHKAAEEELSLK